MDNHFLTFKDILGLELRPSVLLECTQQQPLCKLK